MGTFIFTILVLLMLLFVLFFVFAVTDKHSGEAVVPLFAINLVSFLLFFALPYMFHNSDLATVENGEKIIAIQEEYKSELTERINSMRNISTSLMNQDSPINSMVAQIAESEKKVADTKLEILNAEISIQKRSRGMTSYILWFF